MPTMEHTEQLAFTARPRPTLGQTTSVRQWRSVPRFANEFQPDWTHQFTSHLLYWLKLKAKSMRLASKNLSRIRSTSHHIIFFSGKRGSSVSLHYRRSSYAPFNLTNLTLCFPTVVFNTVMSMPVRLSSTCEAVLRHLVTRCHRGTCCR